MKMKKIHLIFEKKFKTTAVRVKTIANLYGIKIKISELNKTKNKNIKENYFIIFILNSVITETTTIKLYRYALKHNKAINIIFNKPIGVKCESKQYSDLFNPIIIATVNIIKGLLIFEKNQND